MINYDVNLEFAIFSKVYDETLEKVKQDLAKRKQNLKWVYERDNLTADQIKRANTEEEHILLLVEYIQATENLLRVTGDALSNRQELQIDWHQEYIRECEKNLAFTEMMLKKYSKLKNNEEKEGN